MSEHFSASPFPISRCVEADRCRLGVAIWTTRSDSRVRWPQGPLPHPSRPSRQTRPNSADHSMKRARNSRVTSNNTHNGLLPSLNPTTPPMGVRLPAKALNTVNSMRRSCVVCLHCSIWYIRRNGCVARYGFGSLVSLKALFFHAGSSPHASYTPSPTLFLFYCGCV